MNIDSKDQQGIPVGDGRVSNETLCGDNNSDKSKDMLRLLMWPIEHMQSAIKKCKEEWDSESERRLKDKVAAKIYIQDASVDGKIVVALKVNGVVIDYARHSEDKDPEGFRIYNGVDTLIEKMQTIRINEYVRLKMIGEE